MSTSSREPASSRRSSNGPAHDAAPPRPPPARDRRRPLHRLRALRGRVRAARRATPGSVWHLPVRAAMPAIETISTAGGAVPDIDPLLIRRQRIRCRAFPRIAVGVAALAKAVARSEEMPDTFGSDPARSRDLTDSRWRAAPTAVPPFPDGTPQAARHARRPFHGCRITRGSPIAGDRASYGVCGGTYGARYERNASMSCAPPMRSVPAFNVE